MEQTNILIFPAGAENALELREALGHTPRFHVIGGTSVQDHSSFAYPSADLVTDLPFIGHPEFIERLNEVIMDRNIELLFSSHDSSMLYLTENKEAIRTKLVGPDLHTARCCRDKKLLYSFLQGEGFLPRLFASNCKKEILAAELPLFAKPAKSQGSQGCHLVTTIEEAKIFLSQPDMVLCEYLPGDEFTIDCFTDRHGRLLFAGARSRDVVKMGIAFVSSTVPLTPSMQSIANTLNKRLTFRGLWFFQLKADREGNLKLLEVSSRASTTMGLYRQLGVNLPLLSAYDALDMDVEIMAQSMPATVSRSLRSSYNLGLQYNTVYIDYDDTIIQHGKPSPKVMKFLYQCVNDEKKIVLLTRHEGDLDKDLSKMCICSKIFHKIYKLKPNEEKSDFIEDGHSIFIDNLFYERKLVYNRKGIFVFDVDAIESLIRD